MDNKIKIPESLDKAFLNLTDGLTKNIGTTLADIWYLVFGRISYGADKSRIKYSHSLKLFEEELSSSVADIPPEKLLEPSFQVTAQALENAKYCITEETLRKMFTSLISNSLNSDYLQAIHPSFAEIIKQMSPIDASVLKKFKEAPPAGIPICDYRALKKDDKYAYFTLMSNVFLELPEINLSLCSTSISSLERLGIIEIPYGQTLLPQEDYNKFELHAQFQLFRSEYPDSEVVVSEKLARLTPIGLSFVRVCVPD